MEEEAKKTETPEVEIPEKKGGINMKVILFGLPLFVVQLIVVYFVTANILLNKIQGNSESHQDAAQTEAVQNPNDTTENEGEKAKAAPVLGKYIYSVDDVIVNPAGTNGDQLLLSSIAFDIGNEEGEKEIKGKEIVVKDLIISILSSKTISQLSIR